MLLINGYVINVESGEVKKGDILINGHKVEQISYEEGVLEAEQVMDIAGKYVIPGLIDMHVHIKETFAPFFVASGVTTVRNTAGSVLELERLRKAKADDPTPRVISADRMIDGPPGLWGETTPFNVNIDNPEIARFEVRRQVEIGADFIKVYGWLSPDVMASVADEARKLGKEVSCDLNHSRKVNAVDAARFGVKWNEHASGIIQALYPDWHTSAAKEIWDQIDWEEPDREALLPILHTLLEEGVIICPTMTLIDQMNLVNNYWAPRHPLMEQLNTLEGLFQQWNSFLGYKESLKVVGKSHQWNKVIAKMYHDIGGKVVTGTDTPAGIFTYPGLALHRELELFVEAGFTELEALQAATIKAADALNRTDIGRIKEGAYADLVILSEHPLENISHTQGITLIVKGGRVFQPDELVSYTVSAEEYKEKYEQFIEHFKDTTLEQINKISK
ncbi:hypothetical protein AB990_11185 [Alkalihalobacillus pseudalcaliphilus]|nr:hypothetical protein AB990_11185 [Alkalihalobacillus pseudalcaliphilus]